MKSVGNEHVAKQLASLYSSEEDSDCVVVFCVKAGSLQDTSATATGKPLPKRQRVGDGSVSFNNGGRGDLVIVGDPLPGHQLVLRFASEHFGAQLKQWDAKKFRNGTSEQSGPAPATVDGRPVLRVNLSQEEEEPSARTAIRYAYTGDVQTASIREALEIRRQAVNLRIKGCAAACMEIVKAKFAEASNTAVINYSMTLVDGGSSPTRGGCDAGTSLIGTAATGSQPALLPQLPPHPVLELYACEVLWPDLAHEPEFESILQSAKPQLIHYFGNVLQTLNSCGLRQQFLKLPPTAVEVLLESDDFGTDSESSILLLLATWMEANYVTIDACTCERLCRQVRLVQLSRPYLCSILPMLALDFETCSVSGPPQPAIAAAGTASGAPVPSISANTATVVAVAANAGINSGAAACSSSSSSAAWFPIRGAEAAFICSLATTQPPLRDALLAAGRKLYDLSSPWYSLRRRRQCVPATGLVYHWRISEQDLTQALAMLQPGGLCCTTGTFRGDSDFNYVVAGGFEWWPSIEYRQGAAEANLGLYSRMPGVYQVPGSRFTGPKPAVAIVAGVDADLSVHHWHHEAFVDDGVYFSTSKDIWPVGGGRGANVLALRQLQPLATAAATDVCSKGAGGGSSGMAPLAAWSEYVRDGEVAGKLTLLQPSIEHRHGAAEANMGLLSRMPEVNQAPGSCFTAKPAAATGPGANGNLSVPHWYRPGFLDDGVGTSKATCPAGGGRGVNVLASRQLPPPAASVATADVRSAKGDGGGSSGAAPLAAWSTCGIGR
ncbi:hypothetical protein Vretimale_12254 [Volvox reticuliferus]|uniref:BACK domain-containing protein n=1 Tax=Volvox reticuliferus TaxID=1737510 RepID=A0A8J4GK06_9CHLO|nr:hypothetical protein Vretimale_12254 [Volvox reticuliferus]